MSDPSVAVAAVTDVVTASYNYSQLAVWLGNREKPLVEDPAGLWTGQGRGNLSGTGDVDYWSFSAKAGDVLGVGVEVPGSPGASQLIQETLNVNAPL